MISTERAGRDVAIASGEGEIDALYSKLARLTAEAFAPYREQEALLLTDYPALRKKLERALATVFGARKGDEKAPLYAVLVKRAEGEWQTIFEKNAELARAQLQRDPELAVAVERAARDSAIPRVTPDATTWRDPKGRRLIDRVWLAREDTWDRMDQQLRVAIVMKEQPAALAKRVQRWLSPAQARTRNKLGVLE